MTSKQPVLDSTGRFIDAWTWWSKRSPAGEVGQACPGVVLTWANHSWPICNLMFFDHEVSGESVSGLCHLMTGIHRAIEVDGKYEWQDSLSLPGTNDDIVDPM